LSTHSHQPLPWLDAHCHLSDLRLADTSRTLIAESIQRGATQLWLGGTDPEEWVRQIAIQAQFPEAIRTCFGLHPWWVARHWNQPEIIQQALSAWDLECDQADLWGELGLDFGSKMDSNSFEAQKRAFIHQLKRAQICDPNQAKPLVIHCVRAHSEVLALLKEYRPSHGYRGLVHAYASDLTTARRYLELGLVISFGGRAARTEISEPLQACIRGLKPGEFVIESDSPDQPPPGFEATGSRPWAVMSIAQKIAEIRSETLEQVLGACQKAAKNVLPSVVEA
jgi:TatD DNase family protein